MPKDDYKITLQNSVIKTYKNCTVITKKPQQKAKPIEKKFGITNKKKYNGKASMFFKHHKEVIMSSLIVDQWRHSSKNIKLSKHQKPKS